MVVGRISVLRQGRRSRRARWLWGRRQWWCSKGRMARQGARREARRGVRRREVTRPIRCTCEREMGRGRSCGGCMECWPSLGKRNINRTISTQLSSLPCSLHRTKSPSCPQIHSLHHKLLCLLRLQSINNERPYPGLSFHISPPSSVIPHPRPILAHVPVPHPPLSLLFLFPVFFLALPRAIPDNPAPRA